MIIVGEHIVDIQPERAASLLGQPAEETENLVLAVVVTAQRPDTLHVPDGIFG